MFIRPVIILLVIAMCSCGRSYACMCGHSSICDAYQEASVVVIAQVVGIRPAEIVRTFVHDDGTREKEVVSGQEVTLRVSRWFKGRQIENQLKLMQPNSNCDWSFDRSDLNKDYLFYLVKSVDVKSYTVVACGRSGEIRRVAEDIDWLNSNSNFKGATWLSGKASLDADGFPPLKGVEIKIAGPKGSYTYTTNADGVYRIKGALPGKYHISADTSDNFLLAWTTSVPEDWTYFWDLDKPEPKALDVTLEAGKCAGVSFMFKSR